MTMTILMLMMTMTTKFLCGGLGGRLHDLKTTLHVFWHMTLHGLVAVADISEMKYRVIEKDGRDLKPL